VTGVGSSVSAFAVWREALHPEVLGRVIVPDIQSKHSERVTPDMGDLYAATQYR
jgi:hypothetical protein